MKKGMANCLTKTLFKLSFVVMILITTGGIIQASELKHGDCIERPSGRRGILIDYSGKSPFDYAYVRWNDDKEKSDVLFLHDLSGCS